MGYLPRFSLYLVLSVLGMVAVAGIPDVSGQSVPSSPFITTWETTTPGESITIPVGGATGTYTVDWGDGSTTTHEGDATHEYDSPGTYTVQISGDFTRIYLNGSYKGTDEDLSLIHISEPTRPY